MFGFFKKATTNNNSQDTATQVQRLNLSKENLNNVLINLKKETNMDLYNHTAQVNLVIDRSGSMSGMYEDGEVQAVITRLLPLALKFEDNGILESYLFSDFYNQLPDVTEMNYANYVNEVIKTGRYSYGGTQYAPVLKALHRKVGTQKGYPTFVIFITDGDNSDKSETDKIIREMCCDNMFVLFVGIGNASFDYLKKLDNLTDRQRDNTGFLKVQDMKKLTDEQLYTAMLTEYINWLKNYN